MASFWSTAVSYTSETTLFKVSW